MQSLEDVIDAEVAKYDYDVEKRTLTYSKRGMLWQCQLERLGRQFDLDDALAFRANVFAQPIEAVMLRYWPTEGFKLKELATLIYELPTETDIQGTTIFTRPSGEGAHDFIRRVVDLVIPNATKLFQSVNSPELLLEHLRKRVEGDLHSHAPQADLKSYFVALQIWSRRDPIEATQQGATTWFRSRSPKAAAEWSRFVEFATQGGDET